MDLFTKPSKDTQEETEFNELEGQLDRITYTSEETGFTVARLKVQGYSEPVTVVGSLIAPRPGEVLRMKGTWAHHPKFGKQFKITSHQLVLPASIEGIQRYLGSGLIKGIGPVMASRIVEKFGERTLEVIDHHIEDLQRVQGISKKRIGMVKRAWQEQKEIRDVMIFLQQQGVSTGYATKIFKRYGTESIGIVSRNPYRLATEMVGIGFLTADKIAHRMGFEKRSPARVEAGILYVLNQLADEGHVYYPYEAFIDKCRNILEVDGDVIIKAFGSIAMGGQIVIEDLNLDLGAFKTNHKAVYLTRFQVSESGIADHLKRLLHSKRKIRDMDGDKALIWVQKQIRLRLAQKQIEAVKRAISEKVMVITGGPGTGKTTIINAVIKIYRQLGAKILLAAPTGRASKRMSEATGYPARTIHRLLAYRPQKGGFQHNQDRPLEVDVLILDETSMIDTILMYHLLKAAPSKATLIMVGDVNQLPSVGPGNVLKDIIESKAMPVVELKEIFRQAGKSHIVINAHRINNGEMPHLKTSRDRLEDFYFIEQNDPEQVLKVLLDLVCHRIPNRFRFDPLKDIQVLSPMHKGNVGTENLNRALQEALNPCQVMLTRGDRALRLQDKVMQVRNNYEKEVFNGDIGIVTSIDKDRQELVVTFDGIQVPYDYTELDEITLAYAISVHKSQGSEYPAVIIPILTQHYVLLQRNLIYTAVTRGKNLVVMVGSKKALALGIGNDRIMKRYTFLGERLVR